MNYKKRNELTRTELMQALGTQRLTAAQIAKRAGYSEPTVHAHMKWLNQHRQVHIASWENCRSPVYARGYKRNAPRPEKVTNAKRCEVYRERHPDRVRESQVLRNAADRAVRAAKKKAREQLAVGGMWGALIVPGKDLPEDHVSQKLLAKSPVDPYDGCSLVESEINGPIRETECSA